MTQALDAAIQAAAEIYDEGGYDEQAIPAALRAALPAEPPEWWQDWWDHFGFEEVGYSYNAAGWRALRAHLLGEDA